MLVFKTLLWKPEILNPDLVLFELGLYCLYSRPYCIVCIQELFVAVYSQDFEPGSRAFGSLGC